MDVGHVSSVAEAEVGSCGDAAFLLFRLHGMVAKNLLTQLQTVNLCQKFDVSVLARDWLQAVGCDSRLMT